MIRFLFLSTVFFCINVYAGDVLYYVCSGNDPEYEVAALQQVIKNENGVIRSTFALDIASANDEYMTRYFQKGDLIFKSEPLYGEDSVVIGSFEKDGKEIEISIYYYQKSGYRLELSADGYQVKMLCKKKI